ncbi:TIGR03982 family His-Xaa-Ser system protein [Kordiimonas aestuarii]|uniref:TIGR03982 family His-Xaa-Ser system protein n=1 Tax=Kordiimonas aestuarii TaxID=1005925 RepID=UPI0021D1A0BD|nr:TIGR03982 family His-Xaa-Ser system protein [Kordiimonas aestuarii]
MHFVSAHPKSAAAAFLALGIALGVGVQPAYRILLSGVTQDTYSKLMYDCDHSMRTHLVAKLAFAENASDQKLEKLRAAEVGLLSCQDYDLYQKRLMQFGLNAEDLSRMRLVAFEERGQDLLDVVKEHEFRY